MQQGQQLPGTDMSNGYNSIGIIPENADRLIMGKEIMQAAFNFPADPKSIKTEVIDSQLKLSTWRINTSLSGIPIEVIAARPEGIINPGNVEAFVEAYSNLVRDTEAGKKMVIYTDARAFVVDDKAQTIFEMIRNLELRRDLLIFQSTPAYLPYGIVLVNAGN